MPCAGHFTVGFFVLKNSVVLGSKPKCRPEK